MAARVNKGHPKRQARRLRAEQRRLEHVCSPRCKRFRTGRVKWAVKRDSPLVFQEEPLDGDAEGV